MTTHDYHMVMISANIAMLKAKLSFYLGQVKRGHEVLVMDRNTPVARVVPFREARQDLVVIEAIRPARSLRKLKIHPTRRRVDVTGLLREDRDRR